MLRRLRWLECRRDYLWRLVRRLLEDAHRQGFDGVIGWQRGGKSFEVRDPAAFEEKIMRRYFSRQSKYKSFQRQINTYGFRLIDRGSLQGGYYHPNFSRHGGGVPPRLPATGRKEEAPMDPKEDPKEKRKNREYGVS